MSPGKNIRDINLIRSKISLEGDPSLRIHTNEILYHSFFLENGYKNLRYADRINMARKVKYVSELDVLELYNSFRETVHAGLR